MKIRTEIVKGGTPISIYQTVAAAVTTRQAAEFYGQSVTPNGMTLCLFHDDHHPSMKVDERYYCFACHETGNVINYVAQLFDLSNYDATKKLIADFCINTDATAPVSVYKPERSSIEQRCFMALNRYYRILKTKKQFFAPRTIDGPFTFTYGDVDAEMLYVEHLLNVLLEPYGNRRAYVINYLKEDNRLQCLESYINQFRKEVKI
ncbi:MAG: hypothetical protein IJD81_02170 [Oscillospiraceae bacterium]|nr:hypothetical protein [Oscillospiraceae bacterium]